MSSMEVNVPQILIGASSGISFTILFWLLLNKAFVPRIEISRYISRNKSDFRNCGKYYQFAFKNFGNRLAIDLKIRVTLNIYDIEKTGSSTKEVIVVPIPGQTAFVCAPKKIYKRSLASNFGLEGVAARVPTELRKKLDAETLTLDDIFKHYPLSYLKIQILAKDIFSGSAKYIQSENLGKRELVTGKFNPKNLTINS